MGWRDLGRHRRVTGGGKTSLQWDGQRWAWDRDSRSKEYEWNLKHSSLPTGNAGPETWDLTRGRVCHGCVLEMSDQYLGQCGRSDSMGRWTASEWGDERPVYCDDDGATCSRGCAQAQPFLEGSGGGRERRM